MNPLVILDDRRVQQLLADPQVRAAIPPLADAYTKYQATAPKGGCGSCAARRAALEAAKRGITPYTLGNVKTVIGTLGRDHVAALKKILNARQYRITYISPGNRQVTLTV